MICIVPFDSKNAYKRKGTEFFYFVCVMSLDVGKRKDVFITRLLAYVRDENDVGTC